MNHSDLTGLSCLWGCHRNAPPNASSFVIIRASYVLFQHPPKTDNLIKYLQRCCILTYNLHTTFTTVPTVAVGKYIHLSLSQLWRRLYPHPSQSLSCWCGTKSTTPGIVLCAILTKKRKLIYMCSVGQYNCNFFYLQNYQLW